MEGKPKNLEAVVDNITKQNTDEVSGFLDSLSDEDLAKLMELLRAKQDEFNNAPAPDVKLEDFVTKSKNVVEYRLAREEAVELFLALYLEKIQKVENECFEKVYPNTSVLREVATGGLPLGESSTETYNESLSVLLSHVADIFDVCDALAKQMVFLKFRFGENAANILAHDLRKTASSIRANVEYLKMQHEDSEPVQRQHVAALVDAVGAWAQYMCALGDDVASELSRSNSEEVKKFVKNLTFGESVSAALVAVSGKAYSFASSYNPERANEANSAPRVAVIDTVKNIETLDTFADEATWGNLMVNIVQNAAARRVDPVYKIGEEATTEQKKGIDAKYVEVKTSFHKGVITFECADNGVGMSPEYLDPKSPKFIFRIGTTHAGGTGFGLKPAEYLAGKGIRVEVASHRRGESIDSTTFYSNDPKDTSFQDELRERLRLGSFNTVFRVKVVAVEKENTQEALKKARQTRLDLLKSLKSVVDKNKK